MTERNKMSQGERLCWILACMLIATIVAMNAEAVAKQPGECSLTAMAALEESTNRATMPVGHEGDKWHQLFVRFNNYAWYHANGDENKFLRWYYLACTDRKVPRFYRVEDGKIVRGNGS